MRTSIFACLILAVSTSPIVAQAKRDITIDDYFTQADLFSVAYSPKHIAYTEGRWQEATDDRKADLWVVPTTGGASRRLTDDRPSARSPRFSPDGVFVYYLGNHKREGEKRPPFDGKAQVWRVGVESKPPSRPITQVDGGIDAYELSRDGKTLYYLVHVDKIEDDWSGLRSKYSKLEYGHGQNKLGQVWKLDLDTYRSVKLIDAGRNIREFAVSPDGSRIAMITTPDDKVISFEGQSRVDIWDAKSNKITTVPGKAFRKDHPSPWGWLEHLAWNDQCDKLAFGVVFDAYPAEIFFAKLDGAEISVSKLGRRPGLHIRGYGSPFQFVAGRDELMFLVEEKARVRLCIASELADPLPKIMYLTTGDVVLEAFDARREPSDPHAYAAIMASPTQFPDVHTKDGRITNVNPQVASWKLPQLSVVSWKGAGGQEIEGVLELPPNYKKGDKVPLLVEIHGGPTTATYYKLQYWIYGRTLMPAKGYAVLCPNYRGSTGYGDKFTTDLIGRENELDVEDILTGVDALVKRGIVDPERMAVSGWSNGGYLTNCIITRTSRFKAAISGAGIVDAVMEWGANDEPAYTMVFKQGLPWNTAEKYHRASPSYHLDKVKTPTLIHVGANDERCPPAHSRLLYRALKEYVNVPTELIVYPGEGHGLSKFRNRRAKLEWDLAWLDRYVMGRKK